MKKNQIEHLMGTLDFLKIFSCINIIFIGVFDGASLQATKQKELMQGILRTNKVKRPVLNKGCHISNYHP